MNKKADDLPLAKHRPPNAGQGKTPNASFKCLIFINFFDQFDQEKQALPAAWKVCFHF
ncbi:MAG: hypothetical protein KGZ70_00650 [Hydrogenophaga sp.]|nr:hypothetical protein [Hydrogenophaga sp.]